MIFKVSSFSVYAKIVIFFFLLFLLNACAQPAHVERFTAAPAKAPGCDIDVFSTGRVIGKTVKVGRVKISDNGLNFSCHDWPAVEEELKKKACEIGADAIQILKVRSPDRESFCYRATAYFLEYRTD